MVKKSEAKPRCIKLSMEENDHDQIRVAAAIQRVPMTKFCLQAAVADAKKIVSAASVENKQTPQRKKGSRSQ